MMDKQVAFSITRIDGLRRPVNRYGSVLPLNDSSVNILFPFENVRNGIGCRFNSHAFLSEWILVSIFSECASLHSCAMAPVKC